MEIERKWMVSGWPEKLPLIREQEMEQGYLTVVPTVRIRRESLVGGGTEYVLCIKAGTGLVRHEIEFSIEKAKYDDIRAAIGLPLIPKLRRTYRLPDGFELEVNHVDEGQPTEFWYAEIEYPDSGTALAWQPEAVGLGSYLSDEATDRKGSSMGSYWIATRLHGEDEWSGGGEKL